MCAIKRNSIESNIITGCKSAISLRCFTTCARSIEGIISTVVLANRTLWQIRFEACFVSWLPILGSFFWRHISVTTGISILESIHQAKWDSWNEKRQPATFLQFSTYPKVLIQKISGVMTTTSKQTIVWKVHGCFFLNLSPSPQMYQKQNGAFSSKVTCMSEQVGPLSSVISQLKNFIQMWWLQNVAWDKISGHNILGKYIGQKLNLQSLADIQATKSVR